MYSFVSHSFTVGKKAGRAPNKPALQSNCRGIGGIFSLGGHT